MAHQSITSFIQKKIQDTLSFLSNSVAIDLGTANSLVYVAEKGVIYNEASFVSVNKQTDRILFIGNESRAQYGRAPQHIRTIQPIVDGVISEYEITTEVLRYFLTTVQSIARKLLGPRVILTIPITATELEKEAVYSAAHKAGAWQIHLVAEPVAGAIGMGINLENTNGQLIIDIGGGTTDCVVLSKGGIVVSNGIRKAGTAMTQRIIEYIREKHGVVVGDISAEKIKKQASVFLSDTAFQKFSVSGQDITSGLPRDIEISNEDITIAVSDIIDEIINLIHITLKDIDPETSSDISNNGIYVMGGGSLLQGIPEVIEKSLGVKSIRAKNPVVAVVLGAGKIIENIKDYEEVLIKTE